MDKVREEERRERARLEQATEQAVETVDTLLAREQRLEQEMDLLERREAEAISVEGAILDEEAGPSVPVVEPESALSPFTRSASYSIPDDF